MITQEWAPVVRTLQRSGVVFEAGLSDLEVSSIQDRYGFQFPPDLRALLQYALPTSGHFVDWRHDSADDIKGRLGWPWEGIEFDVLGKVFWLDEWGARPASTDDALEIARRAVVAAPVLIPIYSHRYLPAEPLLSGNPVFSVYQSDIIIYGRDLADYFANEFLSAFGREKWLGDYAEADLRPIAFWSDVAYGAGFCWPVLANVSDPEYRAGQVWRYKTRAGEDQSTFTVLKVEPDPKLRAIIHVSIQGLHLKNPQLPTGFSGTIAHGPFSRAAIDNSVVGLLAENAALPDYEEGYREWQKAKGGVWSITVAEAVQAIEDALNTRSTANP